MSKVVVSTFLTLDGVMQDPGGVGEIERGGWQIPFFDDDAARCVREGLFAADALLLGRVTYQSFAAAWPSMTDEDGFADRMNSIPKFVASTTLVDADWNATVIDGDVVDAVSGLKQEHDLLVMGSGALVHALRQHDLIDVYELWVHPVVIGEGKRLFSEPTTPGDLQLLGAKTTGKGVAILTYEAAGRAA